MSLTLAQFLPIWGFLAINILSPGPNVLNTIATAMGSGRGAGLGSATGVALGIACWCLGMSLGMARLFALVPGAQRVLTFAAIALLLTFSARYLYAAWTGLHARAKGLPPGQGGLGFAAGFRRSLLVNALNPKALTSWLAILGLFPLAEATDADLAVLTLGSSAVAFGLHAAYALAFSAPPIARAYLRAAWAVQGAAGLFFATFALRLASTL